MHRYRLPWLMLPVLGGVMPPGIGHAQVPPDESALTLELLERVEQLETEVRSIRGELEVQRHRIELLGREQILIERPASPSGGATNAPMAQSPARSAGAYAQPAPAQQPLGTAAPPPATADHALSTKPAPATPAGSEQAEFDAALGELREGRYQEAVAGFQRFLGAYPTSELAGDTQYWLAESHYVNGDYNAAREAFINLGLHHPQNARLPDALLKLGYIYGELDDAVRAREVLEKLVQVYPDTQAASIAKRRLQSLR